MNVVAAYQHGAIDTNIYIKITRRIQYVRSKFKHHSLYSLKRQRSLYGLKQFGRMWYNRLSNYLLKEGYINNSICPCVFIKI